MTILVFLLAVEHDDVRPPDGDGVSVSRRTEAAVFATELRRPDH